MAVVKPSADSKSNPTPIHDRVLPDTNPI